MGFLAAGRDRGFDQDDRHFAVQVAGILTAALERLRQEEEHRRAALHDPLTGLPNRALILDHLRMALDRSQRHPSVVGVLFVDLDHFKAINDTRGHQAGDAVLVATGERLRAAVRPPDTVGRLGGAEFVAVCEDIGGEANALAVAARLAAGLEAAVRVAGRDVRIRASIGVALSRRGAPIRQRCSPRPTGRCSGPSGPAATRRSSGPPGGAIRLDGPGVHRSE